MTRARTKLRPLEFAVLRQTRADKKVSIQRVVACVSGGADSIALLLVLDAVRTKSRFDLEVVHVHHGPAKSKAQTRFRDRAAKCVEQTSHELGLEFTKLRVDPKTDSEDAAREARYTALENFARDREPLVFALGHHADDLFETRLIRLIRGTGPQGLPAMRVFSDEGARSMMLWRPFLQFSRVEIRDYLESRGRKASRDWLNDPSNRDARYLRNAIRRRLLPAIERLRPGGAASMARSLELMSEFVSLHGEDLLSAESTPNSSIVQSKSLVRADLLMLEAAERRSRLANWLLAQGLRGLSRAHIEEILKRIDTPRKRLSFTLGGRVWLVGREIASVPESTES